jgi:hypothetical protein
MSMAWMYSLRSRWASAAANISCLRALILSRSAAAAGSSGRAVSAIAAGGGAAFAGQASELRVDVDAGASDPDKSSTGMSCGHHLDARSTRQPLAE